MSRRMCRILAFAATFAANLGVQATELVNIRTLPYPFSHVVSFASDVDMQRPWHGAAIHRVFNQDIGLTVSDSLWPQGSSYSSVFFLGYDTLNRTPSGVGTQPVFALLLREWHRGNIDHFHGWQEDGVLQIRNEIVPPLHLSARSTHVQLPDVNAAVAVQKTQNFRLHFASEPPADLSIVLCDKLGKSVTISADAIGRGKKIQTEVGKFGWILEIIIPVVDDGTFELAVDPMLIASFDLIAPSCGKGCAAALIRVERDHFSRQTVQSQVRWLERWNIRPALVTSHGGNTLVQDYGTEGKSLELPRTPGSLFADPSFVVKREALADRKDSHAYHSDILKALTVQGVWSYFDMEGGHIFGPLTNRNARLPPLTTSYAGLYNVPRSTMFTQTASEDKFVENMKVIAPNMPAEVQRSLYCGVACTSSQGDALASLVGQSLYLMDEGEHIKHFWYTHFGSGGSEFSPSLQEPVTPTVAKWMRRLANRVYNFDGTIASERRVWVPPANTWLRYQIMKAGISTHVKVEGDRSAVEITPWKDPVTFVKMPDMNAGSRDLHGLTVYVADSAAASVKVGDTTVDTFTRNPADASGRPSITIVDNNTPTAIIGDIALRDHGDVEVDEGTFADVAARADHILLTPDQSGRAAVTFKPWALDLWNTSHLHLAARRRGSGEPGFASVARLQIDIEMADGGHVVVSDATDTADIDKHASVWRIPAVGAEWRRHTLDVARLDWPRAELAETNWRRPPLPLGRVTSVRITVTGARRGDVFEIGDVKALRPSGNGEAAHATKLVAGRVTIDGQSPLAQIPVQAITEVGEIVATSTDSDGYYFFYNRTRNEKLTIAASIGAALCYPRQGPSLAVLKNEAEVDIHANACGRAPRGDQRGKN